ncbi:MAG: GNAT family N-acetyltransferase [Deltaproteobacteria bacterium]|nr:GNAT family N-acetyltransferase [Deltaproteobacteria bacterium]
MKMIELDTVLGRFRLRPYRDGDREQILALFAEVFGHEKDPEVWEWEFRRNPFGTQVMLCEHESGELVAQCAAIPAPLYCRGEILQTAQLVDCMSKKAYRALLTTRKMGLFAHTTQTFFDTYTGEGRDVYLYGFPGPRHFRLGALLLKYRKVQPYINVRLPLPAPRRNFGRRLLQLTKADLADIAAAVVKLHRADLAAHRLCLYKNTAYLQWRYGDAPRSYTIIGLKSPFRGRLLALACLQPHGDGYRLLDFFGYGEINRLLGQFIAESGSPVSLWLPERYFRLFTRVEPLEDDIGAVPTGRSFHQDLPWDWVREHFFYTMGDCDLF